MRHLLKQVLWLLSTAAVPPILGIMTARTWDWYGVWQMYWVSAIFATLIGVPAGFVIPRVMARSSSWTTAKRIGVFAALMVSLATLGTAAGVGGLVLAGYLPASQFWPWLIRCLKWSFFLSFCVGVVTYGYSSMRHQIEESNEKLRAKELAEQREHRLLVEARLASLESRIHPHFLFNALNSVSSLIREDPAKAELLLERVSALLRFSLYEPHGGLVTLEQELKITRDYLEIESVRFGPRLRYRIECAPELMRVAIPPLAIQTLVENSVKYAITNRREGGEVQVDARLEAGGAVIEVKDSGQGFDATSIPTGHGLDLLAARLDAQFGGTATLEYRRGPVSMIVALKVPAGVAA